jgi:[ribosomal protein S5]-alanine N-acetyltransferase
VSDTFESERLAMRPQRAADAPALHEAYRDAELMRFWSSAPHATLEETAAYLSGGRGREHWRGWSVTLKGEDVAIGTLAAGFRRPGVYEIGYLLARAHWGQGYAREAVTRLLRLLFEEEGARRVFADTDPDNGASNRLLEALGFTLEGRLRDEWETHIGVRDSLIWGMLRDEWLDPTITRSTRS